MYKLIKDSYGGEPHIVNRLSDNAFIPFDLDNTDYQAYLAWVEAGGVPIPAEELA